VTKMAEEKKKGNGADEEKVEDEPNVKDEQENKDENPDD